MDYIFCNWSCTWSCYQAHTVQFWVLTVGVVVVAFVGGWFGAAWSDRRRARRRP